MTRPWRAFHESSNLHFACATRRPPHDMARLSVTLSQTSANGHHAHGAARRGACSLAMRGNVIGLGKNPHAAFETRPAYRDRRNVLRLPPHHLCCDNKPQRRLRDFALRRIGYRKCCNRISAYQVIADCRTRRFHLTIRSLRQLGDRPCSAARTGTLSVTAGRVAAMDVITATVPRRTESADRGVKTSVLSCGGTRCAHQPSC